MLRLCLFCTIFLLSFALIVERVDAAQLSLRSANTSVRQKENLVVDVRGDSPVQKIYTVKSYVSFPPDMLEVSSWSFSNSWIGLSQSGWDLTDNSNGILLKTAGYPRGFSGQVVFGTITFLAKKVGSGSISLDNKSAMYNASNKNVYNNGDTISFSIKKANPKQLFDIRLELDSDVYSQLADVEARVLFESFGSEPTPVVLHAYLESQEGTVLEEKEATVTVETKDLYTFTFSKASVPDGEYVVRVTTLYNNDVRDEFTQSFQIKSAQSAWYNQEFVYGIGAAALVLLGVIIVIRRRRAIS